MAEDMESGIMALGPMEDRPEAPTLSIEQSKSAVEKGLQNASPQVSTLVKQNTSAMAQRLTKFSSSDLQKLLRVIQYLQDNPAEYEQIRAMLIEKGIASESSMPPTYNEEFLATFGYMIMQALQEEGGSEGMEEMPMEMADGGIATVARQMAKKGRNGDTVLAHITPEEAKMLRRRGGAGTRNPATGLPEYKNIFEEILELPGEILDAGAEIVSDVLESPVGRMVATIALATFLGPAAGLSSTAAYALSSAGVSLAAGDSLEQALINGATAYFGAPGGPVSEFLGTTAGITNAALNAAATAGLTQMGSSLLQGKSLADSVKTGLTAGVTGGLMNAGTTWLSGGDPFQQQIVQQGGASSQPATDPNVAARQTVTQKGGVTPGSVNQQIAQQASGAPQTNYSLSQYAKNTGLDYGGEGMSYPMTDPFTGKVSQYYAGNAPAGQVAAAGFPEKTGQWGVDLSPGAKAVGGGQPQSSGGISDLFKSPLQTAKNVYNEYLSPSGIEQQGIAKATEVANAAKATALSANPAMSPESAQKIWDTAFENAMPGMLEKYGPLALAGTAAMAMAGGFEPGEPPESTIGYKQTGMDLLRANPSKYTPQGIRGLLYGDQGQILGGQRAPSATLSSVRVPGVSARRYNEGGIADLQEFPRRPNMIHGPGTEKSDDVPAMLSDGEFVMTARAVRGMGNGSRREGAKRMYKLMNWLESNAARSA